jgi:peptidoglycan/LPS O-acetylase OafA/YrhL
MRWKQDEYPALTGVRACGAIFVFFDHFPFQEGVHPIINVMAFFFVLSGFLIVRLYYDKVSLDRQWLGGYFVKRFARIYPVYVLLLTVAFLANPEFRPMLMHPAIRSAVVIRNYTLTHALFRNMGEVVIYPSWSLTTEETFYLLAPLFMLLIRRVNFFVSFLFALLLLGIALYISILPNPNPGWLFLHTPLFVWEFTFFGHFLEFFAGIGLAVVIMRLEKGGAAAGRAARWGWKYKWTIAGGVGILIMVMLMLWIYVQKPLNRVEVVLVNNLLIPLPIALLYFGLIREKTIVARALSGKLMRILGRSSYSFYLLHTIIIDYVSVPRLSTLFGGHRVVAVLLTFVVTWGISILLYMFYEEPLNRWIRERFIPKRRLAAA